MQQIVVTLSSWAPVPELFSSAQVAQVLLFPPEEQQVLPRPPSARRRPHNWGEAYSTSVPACSMWVPADSTPVPVDDK